MNEKLVNKLKEIEGLGVIVDSYLEVLDSRTHSNPTISLPPESKGILGLLLYISTQLPDSEEFGLLLSTLKNISDTNNDLSSLIRAEINTIDANKHGNLLLNILFEEAKLFEIKECLEKIPFLSLDYKNKQGDTFLHQLANVYEKIYSSNFRGCETEESIENEKLSLFFKIEKINEIFDVLVSDWKKLLNIWIKEEKYIYNEDGNAVLDILINAYKPSLFKDIKGIVGDTEEVTALFMDRLLKAYPRWVLFSLVDPYRFTKNSTEFYLKKPMITYQREILTLRAKQLSNRLDLIDNEEETKGASEQFYCDLQMQTPKSNGGNTINTIEVSKRVCRSNSM